MERDIPLGRIAGIRVGMSPLVPIIAAFWAFQLAEILLPQDAGGYGRATYWTAAVVGSVLFFVSLLIHEIGHALVGRAEHIGVRSMSLTFWGGVTRFEHEARTAGAELRVAGIGPVASGATAVVFWLIGTALSGGYGLTEVLAHVFLFLGFINLLLAAFNILPGSPLDGGKVLGALVWMVTDDQNKGQRVAARVGQGLAIGLVALGLAGPRVVGGLSIDTFLLVVVGGFLFLSASQELRSLPALAALRRVQVGQVMFPDPPLAPEWATVGQFVASLDPAIPHRAFPVQAIDGRITGLLTADAIRASDPGYWNALRVTDLAIPLDRVLVATVAEPVLPVVQQASHRATEQVLVLWPDGRVAGVVGPEAAQRATSIHHGMPATAAPPRPH